MKVDFHVNVPDIVRYTARLLYKAHLQPLHLLVWGDIDRLEALSQFLWQGLSTTDFMAHTMLEDPLKIQANTTKTRLYARSLQLTKIYLTPQLNWFEDIDDSLFSIKNSSIVLINFTQESAKEGMPFFRMIEIVQEDDWAIKNARLRWKYYKQQGHDVINYNAKAKVI